MNKYDHRASYTRAFHEAARLSRVGISLVVIAAAALAVGCNSGSSTGPGSSSDANTPRTVAHVTVTPADASLRIGFTQQFSASATDQAGDPMTGRTVSWSSSDPSVAIVDATGLATGKAVGSATIRASVGGVTGTAAMTVTTPVVTVTVAPAADTLVVRNGAQFKVEAKDSSGAVISGSTTVWSSSDKTVAVVDSTGWVASRSAGQASITVSVDGRPATASLTVEPAPLSVRGLFTFIEHPGEISGYYNGELLQDWTTKEGYTGRTAADEAAAEFDAMRAMGVNTVTMQFRSADTTSGFFPPECLVSPKQGLHWPTPGAVKLANLVHLFDLAQQKGIKIALFLVNTHMEQPADSNAEWLGPILDAVGHHPALSVVLFGGNTHIDPTSGECGTPAEAPLWLGPTKTPAEYVQWAIGFARDRGISPTKLSSEAVVGNDAMESQSPAGTYGTDGHLWDPVVVLKDIFDNLQIPETQRTYALSFYEHRKCSPPASQGCTDMDPADWAEETIRRAYETVGWTTKATVVATEMGVYPPDPTWPTAQGTDDLLTLMEKYGMVGGSFYQWVDLTDWGGDPSRPMPVLLRGLTYSYTPMRDVLVKHYLPTR